VAGQSCTGQIAISTLPHDQRDSILPDEQCYEDDKGCDRDHDRTLPQRQMRHVAAECVVCHQSFPSPTFPLLAENATHDGCSQKAVQGCTAVGWEAGC